MSNQIERRFIDGTIEPVRVHQSYQERNYHKQDRMEVEIDLVDLLEDLGIEVPENIELKVEATLLHDEPEHLAVSVRAKLYGDV
jgi:hypothetical protein